MRAVEGRPIRRPFWGEWGGDRPLMGLSPLGASALRVLVGLSRFY